MITLVVGIVILILYIDLRHRIARLEHLNGVNRAGYQEPYAQGQPGQQFTALTPQQMAAPLMPDGTPAPLHPAPRYVQRGPGAGEQFAAWLKEDWLLKLGVLLLLIGFGWLVTYAFMHNWIGPSGRIAFGIMAGALIMALGWWRIRAFVHQGGIFLVLGSTVILMTVSAGQWFYHFFDPFTSLGLMFISVAFVGLASVKFKSNALSFGGLILAAIAPVFSGVWGTEVQLFFYLLIIVLGTLWVVAINGQRSLTLAALIMVGLYSLPQLLSYSHRETILLFVYGFAMIFFIANTLAILKSEKTEADTITAAGNGLWLLVWIMNAAQAEWRSLIIVAWMVVFTSAAFLIYRATRKIEPFYVYAGVGVAMLAAATAAELDGAALTIAYTIESAIVAIVVHVVTQNADAARRATLLLIGPAVLAIPSIASSAWYDHVLHKDFFVLFVLSLVMFLLGLYLMQFKSNERGGSIEASSTLMVVGSIFAYALIWQSLHAGLRPALDVATMVSLLIYTVIGLSAYIYGRPRGNTFLTTYGGVLLGFVIGRLLLVEVWHMELSGRIITFFIIGTLLISTAFIGRKKPEQVATINQ